MDTNANTNAPNVLDADLIKSANPGINDFGSGNIIALASQCLRTTRRPSDCTICLDGCPAAALDISKTNSRPHTTTDCIRCGFCVSLCPSNALAASAKTVQQITRLLLQAALRVNELAVTCERSFALLRLKSFSDDPRQAQADLKLLNKAVETENLLKVPCLGMLSSEVWFSVLNEIGFDSGRVRLKSLAIYLPVDQCHGCPVNCTGLVDEALADTIDRAERWSGLTVGILNAVEEVPQLQKVTIRDYLGKVNQEVGRRDALTGFLKDLKQTWDENTDDGTSALQEVQIQRERKKAIDRTRIANEIRTQIAGPYKPTVVPLRYQLIESIGYNSTHADQVVLKISQTDDQRCTRCGACIETCPVNARRLVELPETEDLDCPGSVSGEGDVEGEGKAADAETVKQ
ncbi:MAG: 4Fe-4S binding protein, partial [Coriobacteriales bacterium]|nr:4Fe-4S binding protein [Coriobacteriales bacterium]